VSISPLCSLAMHLMAAATLKGQAAGRFPRRAHWWADFVIGTDLVHSGDPWYLFRANVPFALADGVSAREIEAFCEGRLEELDDATRQHIAFVRGVIHGDLPAECWARQVELVGSERGTVEYMVLCLLLNTHVRVAQALGLAGDAKLADVKAILESCVNGDIELGDPDAYDAFFREFPWPDTPRV